MVIEQTVGVNETKICPKFKCKIKIIEFVNIFLCLSKSTNLATIISTINKVRKLSAGKA